jgi:hypothetical protein
MHEELGCDVTPVRRIWRNCTAWQVDLAWWLAELDAGVELRPNLAEVESCQWLTVAELRELPQLLSSNREFLDRWQAGLSRAEPQVRETDD